MNFLLVVQPCLIKLLHSHFVLVRMSSVMQKNSNFIWDLEKILNLTKSS
jgi:hypothetical protein